MDEKGNNINNKLAPRVLYSNFKMYPIHYLDTINSIRDNQRVSIRTKGLLKPGLSSFRFVSTVISSVVCLY